MDPLDASTELDTDPDVTYLRSRESLRVVVGGWSGSGKTVFAKYLAELLRCKYVSASARLVSALNRRDVDWIRDRDELVRLRTPATERALDAVLVRELAETPRIILDSWAGAFLAESYDAAVWIECALDVRTQNAMGPGSLDNDHPEQFRSTREGLDQKDSDSIARFRELYGFTYGPAPEVFRVKIDISDVVSPYRDRWLSERHAVLFQMVSAIRRNLA